MTPAHLRPHASRVSLSVTRESSFLVIPPASSMESPCFLLPALPPLPEGHGWPPSPCRRSPRWSTGWQRPGMHTPSVAALCKPDGRRTRGGPPGTVANACGTALMTPLANAQSLISSRASPPSSRELLMKARSAKTVLTAGAAAALVSPPRQRPDHCMQAAVQ